MTRNTGKIDRGLRGFVGIVFILVFFVTSPVNVYVHFGVLVVGIILLATAVLSWCPLYTIFGINTCSRKTEN